MSAMTNNAELQEPRSQSPEAREAYLTALTFVERLHRRLLDVIKDELDRSGNVEINSVRALLLYNIGDQEMTAGELRTRGHYLGSNVSYNLKKLVEAGYINHQRSEMDRRSVRVRLTQKGTDICDTINDLYNRHVDTIAEVGDVSQEELEVINKTLNKLERFWTDQIRFRL